MEFDSPMHWFLYEWGRALGVMFIIHGPVWMTGSGRITDFFKAVE